MKYDELKEEWKSDCNIDVGNLAKESLRIPLLHNKYYQEYISHNKSLKKLELEYQEHYKIRHAYYSGRLSEEELQEYNLEQFPLILKSDIAVYLNSDKKLQEITMRIFVQKQICDFLESIIKTLNNRTFQIKNAIDFIKFENGIG